MAITQNKRFLLVTIILLCFISIQARARILKEKSNDVESISHDKEAEDHVFKAKEEDHNNGGEVFAMDYTPARRKPPIHN
ncbi:uncharacterized protein LOC127105918 [Lathyrus oleraceus]|uniref:Uncharacterized protein n=1 Tax=Pisum sativum TaxID=3888 RepID=A0A9D4VIU0_PEA|nr:uncharacterized protein LOC127105918 [Pisum sativum]KAI5384296.1 hypothetical protein KIW84_071345 [Pisum sativum]